MVSTLSVLKSQRPAGFFVSICFCAFQKWIRFAVAWCVCNWLGTGAGIDSGDVSLGNYHDYCGDVGFFTNRSGTLLFFIIDSGDFIAGRIKGVSASRRRCEVWLELFDSRHYCFSGQRFCLYSLLLEVAWENRLYAFRLVPSSVGYWFIDTLLQLIGKRLS